MPFAPETYEVDFLMDLFRQLKLAKRSQDYGPVERLVHPDALLRTRDGESRGREAVLAHLRQMEQKPYRMDLVAPKGGLMTVLVAPLSHEGVPIGRGREQVYHIMHGQLVELIDIGRTPQLVNRPESQPN